MAAYSLDELRLLINQLSFNDNAKVVLPIGKTSLGEYQALAVDNDGGLVVSSMEALSENVDNIKSLVYGSSVNRPVTRYFFVSPNGDNSDGLTWSTAYNSLTTALDNATVNDNELTLILLAPGVYDINTAGDPTWSANVEIYGSHRSWVFITNSHSSATSILNLTGFASISSVTIDCESSINGLKFTRDGARIYNTYIECKDVTGVQKAVEIAGAKYARIKGLMIHGNVSYTTALVLDDCSYGNFEDLETFDSLVGLHIKETSGSSDKNYFSDFETRSCTTAFDLDAGDNQIFNHIIFVGNTTNVDDIVGNHFWHDIRGSAPRVWYPDNFSGATVTAGVGANTWGSNVEIRSAAEATKPFRIVDVGVDPVASEKYKIRLYDGSVYFDEIGVEGGKGLTKVSSSFLYIVENIFNKGTAISASAKSESGNNDVNVWVKVQEI